MAADNKLKVQGRIPREETFSYKGEKLDDESKYVLNDVVSINNNGTITFKKRTEQTFVDYPDFQLNILDKSFTSEAVYYYTLNNAFNTCRITTYNLMNLLKDYSNVNNITLDKDTSSNDCNTILEDSLTNLIKYNFYNSTERTLYSIDVNGTNSYFQIVFYYKTMGRKYRPTGSTTSTVSSGGTILCRINDTSLEFINSNKYLKHKNMPNYSYDQTSSGSGYGTRYYDVDYNRSGWDQIGTFYNYTLDEQGHIINKELKTVTLPKKPRFQKTILFSGDRGTGTLSETFNTDTLLGYDLIEVVFRNNDADTIESVYIEPCLIPVTSGTTKFRGVTFKTTETSSSDSYGGTYTSRSTTISISKFYHQYAVITGVYAGDDEVVEYENNMSHIILIIAYEQII